uniref:MHC class I-like antigen recognition-like domain-containing protein n=1 Tax=Gopherus agassizii TaxID=38772 RepID=A0A452HU96_9SAUR
MVISCKVPNVWAVVFWDSPSAWGLHSRHVLDTVVSEPGLGLPWYSRVGYVDNQIIYIYTSEKQRVEPRPVWMAQNEGLEFWHERTCLDTLRELYNQKLIPILPWTLGFLRVAKCLPHPACPLCS